MKTLYCLIAVIILFLFIGLNTISNAYAQNCYKHRITYGVWQEGNPWCAPACVSFLMMQYGGFHNLCTVVAEFCVISQYHSGCYACCEGACIYDEYTNLHMVEAMNDMNFNYNGLNIVYQGGILSTSELDLYMCQDTTHSFAIATLLDGGTGKAHTVTLIGYDSDEEEIQYMDPNDGEIHIIKHWALVVGILYPAGLHAWAGVTKVNDYCGWVGIGDIQSYYLYSIDSGYPPYILPEIILGYGVSHEANPADSASIYISDNPLGPARRISRMTYLPILDDLEDPPEVNTATDYWRPMYNDHYYYFLNHGSWFPDRMMIADLYSNSDNPIILTNPQFDSRPIYDSPSNVLANDIELDYGCSLEILWDLSHDDTLIDYYNVYRRDTSMDYSSNYKYLLSLPPGSSSFIDTTVFYGAMFAYKISAAHHGNEVLLPDCGYYGMWNDFSEESNTCEAVNNYFIKNIELLSNDSLVVCPRGDSDTVKVQISIRGSDNSPTQGVLADEMLLSVIHDSLYICGMDTIVADRSTDENGLSLFSFSGIGGHGHMKLVALVNGISVIDTLLITVKSPDYSPNGYIDLVDFGLFNNAMSSNCGDANYNEWFDFDSNCAINLVDYAIFSDHWQHACQ